MRLKYSIRYLFFVYLLLCSALAGDQIDRPKVGLVLSGGGARGFAHVGVLKILDSLNFPVDYIAGTSIGGLIGALYSCGYSGIEIEEIVNSANWDELLSDMPKRKSIPYLQKYDDNKYQLTLGLKGITPVMPRGLIQGQKVSLLISELLVKDNIKYNFDNLKIPFQCVAVDLVSGNEVILKSGSLAKAMRATMSIPTIFSPVEWGDSLLIDGGIINNFPSDVVKDMGADIIIGVDIGSRLVEKNELRSLIEILNQTLVLIDYDRLRKNRAFCDLVLLPELGNFYSSDFDNDKIKHIQKAGEKTGYELQDKLTQLQADYNLYKETSSVTSPDDSIKQDLKIYGISITGNKKLPFNFINRLLGLKPDDIFDKKLINQRIGQLYGLDYFELIQYEVEKVDSQNVRLHIKVKEKPFRKFQVGLHYDNFYEIVARLGVKSTSAVIPGVRLESSLEFAGLFNYNLNIAYPSRNLNLPIYPYLRFNYQDIPVNIYNPLNGDKIAEYSDESYSIAGGFGILVGRSGNIIVEYNHQKVDIDPKITGLDSSRFASFKDDLRKIHANLAVDMIDNSMLPRKGICINADIDAGLKRLNSDRQYQQYKLNVDMYHTLFKRHTIALHTFYTNFGEDIPIYKYATNGNANTFVGMKNDQLVGDKYGFIRMDYRYEYKRDIFLKLIFNTAAYDLSDMIGIRDTKNLYGYGLGVKFLSILGNIEFIISQGSKSLNRSSQMQTRFYFNVGYTL